MISEREGLDGLSERSRRDRGVAAQRYGVGVLGLSVARRVRVACHPQPWARALHLCVPLIDGGQCRILGRAGHVTEVAGVVLRLVRCDEPEAETWSGGDIA
jgi:hypothetical protein